MSSKSKRRNTRKHRSSTRKQRGGAQGPYPDSAWGFQLNNVGSGWPQFLNTFSTANSSSGNANSNVIVPNNNSIIKLKGGRRNKKSRKH